MIKNPDFYQAYDIEAFNGYLYIAGDSNSFNIVKTNYNGKNGMEVNAGGSYSSKLNQEIQFYGIATGGIEPYSYKWDFNNNDGIQEDSTEQNPKHSYDIADEHVVTLIVEDFNGMKSLDTAKVKVTSSRITKLLYVKLLRNLLENNMTLYKLINYLINHLIFYR
jgi:hypothetical protein